jgi:hypothetical protein
MEYLSEEEEKEIVVGAGVTLASIAGIVFIAIAVVVIYRLFKSSSAKTKLPGGYSFEWK